MKELLGIIGVAVFGVGFILMIPLFLFANMAAWVLGWLWLIGWLN